MSKQALSAERLPCPFCGSTELTLSSNGMDSRFVECDTCGTSGPAMPTDPEAETAWNTRKGAGRESAMPENGNKDGIQVKKDQVWRDLDSRMINRHCRVAAVRDGKAIMYRCTAEGEILTNVREMKISIARMQSRTGWALVKDAR